MTHGMIYGPDNRPIEITFKVRPANPPNLPQHVAESVADFCRTNSITEHMIRDIVMEVLSHGEDEQGSFTHVRVFFSYQ
jgi:hypothetical protein